MSSRHCTITYPGIAPCNFLNKSLRYEYLLYKFAPLLYKYTKSDRTPIGNEQNGQMEMCPEYQSRTDTYNNGLQQWT